jgi:cytochrome c peroxidase
MKKFFFGLLWCMAACSRKEAGTNHTSPSPVADATVSALTSLQKNFFAPLPNSMKKADEILSPDKVALGRKLFHETKLSKAQDISCATCHSLDTFGADQQTTSTGHKGQKGGRNAPTVLNAAGHVAQFWDGRAADVEEQAKGPVLNPIEMAMPHAQAVEAVLKKDAAYPALFKAAFPQDAQPITFDNMAKAIAAFERTLVTPSRWDAYLKGDNKALTAEEVAGAATFVDAGCTGCHMGPYVGGSMFQVLGLQKPWPHQEDLGRYNITHQDSDKMVFKVPSLRNVEKTAPYFHDGKVASLEEAVQLMGRHQLGKELSPKEVQNIVAWLKTLTGTLPAQL